MINQIIVQNIAWYDDKRKMSRERTKRQAMIFSSKTTIGLVRNTSNVNMARMYNEEEEEGEQQHINNYLSKMPHHTESRGMPSTNPFLLFPRFSYLFYSISRRLLERSLIHTGSSLQPEATCICWLDIVENDNRRRRRRTI